MYNPRDVDSDVAAASETVYLMARAYLDAWGVTFKAKDPLVAEKLGGVRSRMHREEVADKFLAIAKNDKSGGLSYKTGVRNVDSRFDGSVKYRLPDIVGKVPDNMVYPMSKKSKDLNKNAGSNGIGYNKIL